ncbi:formylglycine-generating enzyme [Gammaproteobacteria bacterium]
MGLAARYRILEQLPTQGAEADLLLVEPLPGGERVVVKLYRRGIQPKNEVLARLAANVSAYVVRLLDHGQSEGVGYEILEYCERGSLQDLLAKGAMGEKQVRALLTELSAALRELHAQGILHRDLKPGNVLIRSEQPLILVLTDFGIASVTDSTLHFTSAHRTVRYAAPEAASGVVSVAADYWSLGMILAEALTGRHPFSGLSEVVIQYQLNTQAVPLVDISEPWLTLCRGLLLRDPSQRWGDAEIGRWLAGDKTLAVPVEIPAAADVPAVDAHRAAHPYKLQGTACWTARELAAQLAKNWERGTKDLQRGLLLPWLKDELRDQDLTSLLMDLLEEGGLTPDERLFRLILQMAPNQPPVWREISMEIADLAALARRAMQNDADAKRDIQTIRDRGLLTILATIDPRYLEIHRAWQEAETARIEAEEKAKRQAAAKAEAARIKDEEDALLRLLRSEMVAIPGGTFMMGSPETEKDRNSDERQHQVTINGFEMAKTPVTQSQWKAVMGNNPSYFQGCNDCPVEQVSWNDAIQYIEKLNALTGGGYRLPTEAEWEYAGRGGRAGKLYCGGNNLDAVAWYYGNSDGKTHPVGQKAPNGYGLYDMSGNVWEWTCSEYDGDYGGGEQHCQTSSDADRVYRGGSWFYDPLGLRAASRGGLSPGSRGSYLGFRLARTL